MTVLRWTARLLGALVAVLSLASGIAGLVASGNPGPEGDALGVTIVALLSVAAAGMLVAWRHELAGAAMTLGGGALASVLILLKGDDPLSLLVWLPIGLLFLGCGVYDRSIRNPARNGKG